MINIKLLNMPFADITIPSIALTQLKVVTEAALGQKVNIEIIYLNHDFGKYVGVNHYRIISNSSGSNNSDFGDWFFRQEAFPEEKDNTEDYLGRYAHLIGIDYLRKDGAFLLERRKNLDAFFHYLIDKYGLAEADIIGFTSMFMQQVGIIAMARKLKKIKPNIITIIGGANCETPMGERIIALATDIDYVFSGGSLISFPQLVENILTGNASANGAINGVFTRSNCMNIVQSKAKVLMRQDGDVETSGPIGDEMPINACVPLDYDSFLQSFESIDTENQVKPYLLFETSRGCWWGAKAHCTFCGLNGGGMTYRAMKSELAVKMLNDLFLRYSHKIEHFSCVDNIIPKEYVRDVFPYLDKPTGITMFYEVKADLTSEEMKVLSEAGVVEMQPGIESLATFTLKLMRKGTTSFNNIRFLQDSVRYSITSNWNLLIGFPGEPESIYEKYHKDIPLLYHLPPPQGVFPVRFDRYSPYFNDPGKYGLDLQPLDYYSLIYPYPKEALSEIAYYFSDHNFDSDYLRYTAIWVQKLEKQVETWKNKWLRIQDGIFPRVYLYSEAGDDFVFDSREEPERRINISETEKKVLNNLIVRKNIEGLCAQMKNFSEDQLNDAVKNLRSRGFLFEENATYMSLVFDQKPVLLRSISFH